MPETLSQKCSLATVLNFHVLSVDGGCGVDEVRIQLQGLQSEAGGMPLLFICAARFTQKITAALQPGLSWKESLGGSTARKMMNVECRDWCTGGCHPGGQELGQGKAERPGDAGYPCGCARQGYPRQGPQHCACRPDPGAYHLFSSIRNDRTYQKAAHSK